MGLTEILIGISDRSGIESTDHFKNSVRSQAVVDERHVRLLFVYDVYLPAV